MWAPPEVLVLRTATHRKARLVLGFAAISPPSRSVICVGPLRGLCARRNLQATGHAVFADMIWFHARGAVHPTAHQVRLKHENEKLKIALATSGKNAKKWELDLKVCLQEASFLHTYAGVGVFASPFG